MVTVLVKIYRAGIPEGYLLLTRVRSWLVKVMLVTRCAKDENLIYFRFQRYIYCPCCQNNTLIVPRLFAPTGDSTTVSLCPIPDVSSPTNGSQPSGSRNSWKVSSVKFRLEDVECSSTSLFPFGCNRPNSRVMLTSVVTKIRSSVFVTTGQNTGSAAQTAARCTSRQARPEVVGLYQLGSKRKVFAVKCLMTKTMRKMTHNIALRNLSVRYLCRLTRLVTGVDGVLILTYKRPRTKRPNRENLVFLSVPGSKQSGKGIAKIMKSRIAVVVAWVTKTRV